jgi:serine phosphatase RsbU (regulator of sigma subunit)
VNCGHPAPVLLKRDGALERLDPTGTVVGAFENSEFEQRTIPMRSGDRVVVFSDGVSEAREDEDDAWVAECVRMLGRTESKSLAESLAMAASTSLDDVTVMDLLF